MAADYRPTAMPPASASDGQTSPQGDGSLRRSQHRKRSDLAACRRLARSSAGTAAGRSRNGTSVTRRSRQDRRRAVASRLTARSPAPDLPSRISQLAAPTPKSRSDRRTAARCARTARPVCWGDSTGQLAGAVTQVAVGDSYSCGLTVQATVTCAGNQPPTGGPSSSSPADRTTRARSPPTARCSAGATSRSSPTDSFLDVSAGSGFSCGVRSDATLSCWGTNLGVHHRGAHRHLSRRSRRARAMRARSPQAARPTCWGNAPSGQPPTGTFMQLSAGDGFACGIATVCCGVVLGRQLQRPVRARGA